MVGALLWVKPTLAQRPGAEPAVSAAQAPATSVYSGGLELRVRLHQVEGERREPLTKAVKEAADNVQAYLRGGLDGAVDIDLVGSEDAFSQVMTQHAVQGWDERWLAGLAMLDQRRIIVHVNGTRALTTRETLEHELVHVGLHAAARGRFLPTWYQEGVATLLAGEATFERLRDLAGAAPLGQLESLHNLNEGFHGSQVARQRAYATAAGFLQFATRRVGGIGAIAEVQRRLQEGADLDRAFAMTFGAPPADLYAVYAAQIQASASAWAVLFSDSAIWSVVSLLGMFAMVQAHRNRPRPEPTPRARTQDPTDEPSEDDEPIDLEAVAAAGQQALNRPWQRLAQRPVDADGPAWLGQRADSAAMAMSQVAPEDQPWPTTTEDGGDEASDAAMDAATDAAADAATDAANEGDGHADAQPQGLGSGDRRLRPWQVRDFTVSPLRAPAVADLAPDPAEPAESPKITADTAAAAPAPAD